MTLLDCFDMGYGTLACVIKEAVIIYLNYARAVYVNKVRYEATRAAMMGQAQDQRAEDRLKRAREEGNAAAMQASVEAQHILGPIISSWWDFFVTLYAGGTLAEGVIRGMGTFFGAYVGGIIGEEKFDWLGFLGGSQVGTWMGGKVGLMAYDVLHFVHNQIKSYGCSKYFFL